jgi:hypothetical protein
MASPSNPNTAPNNAAAAGGVTPGLAPLAPPAGAYFGRYTPSPFAQARGFYPLGLPPQPGSAPPRVGSAPNQDIVQQSINEFFVYWINGTPSTSSTPGIPGYYLIIMRQSFISSVAALVAGSNRVQGWMLYYVHTGTQLGQPTSGSSLALLATSPNTGDQYAYVRQGITPKVFISGSASQPVYLEVTDQVPLNLPGWAVQNKQFLDWGTKAHDMNTAYWEFRQTTPWDPQVMYLGQAVGRQNHWWWTPFFVNNAIVPIPDISHSSLSVTTYATWMVTNSAWTQDEPPTCHVQGQFTMKGDAYFISAWSPDAPAYQWPPDPGQSTAPLSPGGHPFPLQLDQIVQKISP